jgi:transposase
VSEHPFIGRRRFVAACISPYPDESLLGFVTRALRLTAVRQLKAGLRVAGATRPEPVAITTTLSDPAQIASLAYAFGCDPEEIRSRTYAPGTFDHSTTETLNFFGTKIRSQYFEAKVRRVAPRALEIEPYHRAISQLRPFSFDPLTNETLLDTCPVCNRKLGWRRAQGATMCDKCVDGRGLANVDLRDFPQVLIETGDPEALRFVTDLVDPLQERKASARRLLPASWHNISNAAVFEAVMALAAGLTMDPAASKSAQGRVKHNDDFQRLTPHMLALAGRAIINGEKGFAALADRYRADMDKRPRHYGRRKELGPLAYLTYDRHLDPAAKALLKESVDSNMKITSRAHTLRIGDDADGSWQSIDGFAEKFNVRPSTLRRLARSGLVPVITAFDAKRSPVRMSVADVEPLLEQMRDVLGELEAAGLLGLPVHVMASLADRKLIDRLEGPVLGLVAGKAGYTKSSVHRFLERLWRCSAGDAPEGAVPLITAARSIGAGAAPWAAIVSAILAGQVQVFADVGKRKSIRYALAVADVGEFAAAVRCHLGQDGDDGHPDWIGNATAAEMLKVTEVFVWRLAKRRPDTLKSHDNGYTPFRFDDVATIARTYIFVPEVMDRADMKARRACGWLKSHGIKPAFSLQDNRDFAFLRKEVEPLLANQAASDVQRVAALPAETGDLRTRLVKAVANGAEIKATAKKLGVGYREAVRWVTKWRASGILEPEKKGKKSPLDREADWLRNLVAGGPDLSLSDIQEKLAERGVRRSQTAIWNCLERNGIELGGRRKRK